MHDDRKLVEARLRRFVDDHVRPALYRAVAPVAVSAWVVPGEPVGFDHATAQSFAPVEIGWRWGTAWSTVWLRVTGEVPAEWTGVADTRGELLVDFGYNRSRS
ncbi:MAG: alpha-mannosidase 2C1, partial [Rhodoglobus sp.]